MYNLNTEGGSFMNENLVKRSNFFKNIIVKFFPKLPTSVRLILAFVFAIFFLLLAALITHQVLFNYDIIKNQKEICDINSKTNPCFIKDNGVGRTLSGDEIRALISGKSIKTPLCIERYLGVLKDVAECPTTDYTGEYFAKDGLWKFGKRGIIAAGMFGKWKIKDNLLHSYSEIWEDP
jgi:hypothetical protein